MSLYEAHLDVEQMREMKRELLLRLDQRYTDLKMRWGGYGGFDGWFDRGVNNARLASLATYRDLVPAFQALLASHGGDLKLFYATVAEIGRLSSNERIARLNSYLPSHQARAEWASAQLPGSDSNRVTLQ